MFASPDFYDFILIICWDSFKDSEKKNFDFGKKLKSIVFVSFNEENRIQKVCKSNVSFCGSNKTFLLNEKVLQEKWSSLKLSKKIQYIKYSI